MNSGVKGRGGKLERGSFNSFFEDFCCEMKEGNRAAVEGKVGSRESVFNIREVIVEWRERPSRNDGDTEAGGWNSRSRVFK